MKHILIFLLLFFTNYKGFSQNLNISRISKLYFSNPEKWISKTKRNFICATDKSELKYKLGINLKDLKKENYYYIPIIRSKILTFDTTNFNSILNSLSLKKSRKLEGFLLNENRELLGESWKNEFPNKLMTKFYSENDIQGIDYIKSSEIIKFKPDYILLVENTSFSLLLVKENKVFVLNDSMDKIRPTYKNGNQKFVLFEEFYKNNIYSWKKRIW